MELSPDDVSHIASALRVAAIQYATDAASNAGIPRLAEQFDRQAQWANAMADRIEGADAVYVTSDKAPPRHMGSVPEALTLYHVTPDQYAGGDEWQVFVRAKDATEAIAAALRWRELEPARSMTAIPDAANGDAWRVVTVPDSQASGPIDWKAVKQEFFSVLY